MLHGGTARGREIDLFDNFCPGSGNASSAAAAKLKEIRPCAMAITPPSQLFGPLDRKEQELPHV
jgi:hypothetical protein